MPSMRITVFKAWGARTNRQWSNVYEVSAEGAMDLTPGDPVAFGGIAQAIVAAERQIHFTNVYFHRYTISTWQPDSQPYNPLNLVTVPLDTQGLNPMPSTAGQEVDLRVVLLVDRVAPTGRPGRLFYRGCLAEGAIEAHGGYWRQQAGSPTLPGGTAWTAYKAALAPWIGGGAETQTLVLIGGKLIKTVVPHTESGMQVQRIKRTYGPPWHIRPVTDLVPTGVSVRQAGNRYFDRPA